MIYRERINSFKINLNNNPIKMKLYIKWMSLLIKERDKHNQEIQIQILIIIVDQLNRIIIQILLDN